MHNGFAQDIDTNAKKVFLPEDSCVIKVKRLLINSKQSDFSPILFKNNLFFASGRPSDLVVTYTNELETEITDLFSAEKRDSVSFIRVKPFSKNINTKFNESSFTLNSYGDTLYYTGNAKRVKKNKDLKNRLQIYRSIKIKETWCLPTEASFSDPAYSNFHPTFSKDNSMIIFCSDMPGGFGGIDLYYTKVENNDWIRPVNMGALINSADNELFPYLSATNQLYFSSNRLSGLGGLDIYSFNLLDLPNSKAIALRAPINSAFDDFGICLDSAETTGYFTSNRQTSTGDDIYFLSSVYPDFSMASLPTVKNKFCYTFFEENKYQSSDTVLMTYEWDFGDGQKIQEASAKHCFNKAGEYKIQLNIIEKSSGEIFFNEVTYTLSIEPAPCLFINCPDTIVVGNEIMIDAEKCAIKGYRLTGLYWSFGDGRFNTGSFVKHTFNKTGNYTIQLGVTAKDEKTKKIEKFKIEKNIIIKQRI